MKVTKLKFYHLFPVYAGDQKVSMKRDENNKVILDENNKPIFEIKPTKTFTDFIKYITTKYPNFDPRNLTILVKDRGELPIDQALDALLNTNTYTNDDPAHPLLTRPKLRGTTFAFDENGNCEFSVCIYPDEYSKNLGRLISSGRLANKFYAGKGKKKILIGEYLFVFDRDEICLIPTIISGSISTISIPLCANTPITAVNEFYKWLKKAEDEKRA